MKLWNLVLLSTVSILTFSSCSNHKPTPKQEAKIDKTLPIIQLTKAGIFVDMNAVAFEWNIVEDPRVRGIYIYKNMKNKETNASELVYYKTIDNRFATHFVDSDVKPSQKYSYAFKTYSEDAEGRFSSLKSAYTLKTLESVAWIYSQNGLPRTAKIIWRPHSNLGVKSYIVERKTIEDEEWQQLAEIEGRLNAEYIDTELKDNYIYKYRVKVKTYDDIVSSSSKIVKTVTKALPIGINTIHTTQSLPKKIDITWEKSKEEDFYRYHLYRSESIDGNYELIAALFNAKFTDKLKEDGKTYFYRVSVVDKDGLESVNDVLSVQGTSLVRPNAPAIINASLEAHTITLSWNRVDPRTMSYKVVRNFKAGWFDEEVTEFKGIQKRKFVDQNVQANSTYTYTIYAVDKYGISSLSSETVTLKTPESEEVISKSKKETISKAPTEVIDEEIDSVEAQVIAPNSDLEVNEL